MPLLKRIAWMLIVVFVLQAAPCRLLTEDSNAQSQGNENSELVSVPVGILQNESASDENTESTVFDLYLSDKFRGAVLVQYTDTWFQIDEPKEALELLPELNRRNSELLPLVSGKIERERKIEGIGRIYYDLSTFRVILEVDPAFLKSSEIDLSRKLMSPDSGFTLQQNFGVSGVAADSGDSQSALSHRSFASRGEFFSRIDGVAVKDRPYELNEATAGGILGSYQLKGGLLQLRGQNFSPSLQFTGLQLETAEQLFLDDDLAKGSRLEIFVPSRATVQFYRAGQLLAVKVLEYGLQEIDTTAFPQGSYDIDIIINEYSGTQTRERRFFTKAGFLASRGRPVFSFSFGTARSRLDIVDKPLGQAGVRFRVSDLFDVGSGISTSGTDNIGSLDLNGFYRGVRVIAGTSKSDQGASGVVAGAGLSALGINVDARVTRTYGTVVPRFTPTPTPTPTDSLGGPLLTSGPRTDLVILPQSSTSLSISRTVGPFDFRYNVQRNQIEGDQSRFAKGPTIDWRIRQRDRDTLTAAVSALSTENGHVRSAQVLYRRRLSERWTFDAQFLQRYQSDHEDSLVLLGFTFDSLMGQAALGSKIRAITEVQHQKPDDQTLEARTSLTGSVTADVVSQYSRSIGFARNSRTDGVDARTYGINVESSFFVTDEGQVNVAHPIQSESAFIAEVAGDDLTADSKFEVLVDGQIKETIRPGERAVIGLAPFKNYKASIRPTEDSTIVNYDTTIHQFTIFPGNVVKRSWRVDKVYILLARIVDEDGVPISRERIRGTKEFTFSEEDGSIQAEITGRDALFIDSKRHKCTIEFSLSEKPEYYYDAGDLVCRTVSAQ